MRIAKNSEPDYDELRISDNDISYTDAFKELKKSPDYSAGIQTVTIMNCYGGTALDASDNLPAGTILQSLVSGKVEDVAAVT